ncbi:MAG: DUF3899 domain-containing protein [Erysipelotrichaceae bacterium]|nr:DUF3899 domain-containing protein [Erysipelotrichaceae bacterium]
MLPSTRKKLNQWIAAMIIAAILFGVLLLVASLNRELFDVRLFSDVSFISGVILLGMTTIVLIGNKGTFDVIQYGFSKFWHYIRIPRKDERGNKEAEKAHFKDAYEYMEYKEEKRRAKPAYFLPYYVIGLIITVIGIVLSFVAVA